MKQEIKKRLIFYPCLFTVIGVSAYLWGPAFVQSRNMRQAWREIELVKKELETDTRFSQLKFGVGTVHLGRVILVRGKIPDKQNLEYLKSLMEKKISPKFIVSYIIKTTEEKKEKAKPILSEKEKLISKIISDYIQMGFSVEAIGPMTIEEVEKKSLDELSKSSRKDIPKLPFGFQNDKWNKFKSNHKDGDEIYYFTSDEDSWNGLYGRAGYALIRDENVVSVIITMLN